MLYFGNRFGFLSTVAVVATLVGGTAGAQALRDARGPAEFPPASYTANQYVDSRGCVFVRAGIGGATEWVPRVSRTRDQLCGFQPSNVAGATNSAPAVNAPNPLDTRVAGLAPRTAPATPDEDDVTVATPPAATPAPVAPATAPTTIVRIPAPAPRVAAPAPSTATAGTNATPRAPLAQPQSTAGVINPLTGRPEGGALPRAPVATASPSPRVITAPAPVAQPRVLTRAQACAGRTGVQPNLISQRTGQPINCGGATAPSRVATAATPSAVLGGQRARLNRAQACADSAATGRQYVSARTGLPIQCDVTGGRSLAQLRADLAAPQRPYSNPLDAAPGTIFADTRRPQTASRSVVPYSNPLDSAPGTTTFTPGVNTQLTASCGAAAAGSLAVRCGPQAQSPSGMTRQSPATVTRARTNINAIAPTGIPLIDETLNLNPPPYSNPRTTYALPAPTAPQGYTNVWDDGRLNTQRGIRNGPQTQSPSGLTNTVRYATAPRAQAPAVEQPRVSTRVAPQAQTQPRGEQISGHRYVQVGTFSTRDQAQSVAQALRSRGLPMRVGVFNQQGREMRIVLAGPFGSDSQLQGALRTARGAGYGGAFTRR